MISTNFLDKSRYYLAIEYPSKIHLAVQDLSDEDVWRRANEQSNSIGNLIVHLAGNVSEWILSGIGGEENRRDRASEFAMRDGARIPELLALLGAAVHDADRVIASLDEDDLERQCTIQGRHANVLDAIYHVVEHFSMHTGQIILLSKMYAPGGVHFYDDARGKAVPLWGGNEGIRSP